MFTQEESMAKYRVNILLKKTINPFKRPIGNRNYQIYVSIEIRADGKLSNGKLSISGVEGPNRWGNCAGSCGQIDMGYDHKDKSQNRMSDPIKAKDLIFNKGWERWKWYKLLDIWHTYHLKNPPLEIIEFLESLPETINSPAWV